MNIGRTLMIAGALLFVVGLLFSLSGRLPGRGPLPGDIVIQGKNTTFSFPIVTSIVLSLVLTLVMWFLNRR
jgi:hypothetical protein